MEDGGRLNTCPALNKPPENASKMVTNLKKQCDIKRGFWRASVNKPDQWTTDALDLELTNGRKSTVSGQVEIISTTAVRG